MKKILLLLIIFFFASTPYFAQLKFGGDIYSRYIWRGLSPGGYSPSLQHSLSYSTNGFTFGFWRAYSYPDDSIVYAEIDIYASYFLTTERTLITDLSITATKSVSITDKFAIPINVSYIVNPNADIICPVFGVSFTS